MGAFRAMILPLGKTSRDQGNYPSPEIEFVDTKMPMALKWQKTDEQGHDGGYTVGAIEKLVKLDNQLWAYGTMLNSVEAAEASEQIIKKVTAPSVEIVVREAVLADPDGVTLTAEGLQLAQVGGLPMVNKWTKGELVAVTLVSVPNFRETSIELCEGLEPELVAEVPVESGPVDDAVPMAAAMAFEREVFPAEAFTQPEADGPVPIHVNDQGFVVGHAATWDNCHLGLMASSGRCRKPEKSKTGYRVFHQSPPVKLDNGADIRVGRLTVGGGHGTVGGGVKAAIEHYDSTGTCWALVQASDGKHGIWVSGVVNPRASADMVREALVSPNSGHWEPYQGSVELVAIHSVNSPGLPIFTQAFDSQGAVRAMAASVFTPQAEPVLEDVLNDSGVAELIASVAAEAVEEYKQSEQLMDVRGDVTEVVKAEVGAALAARDSEAQRAAAGVLADRLDMSLAVADERRMTAFEALLGAVRDRRNGAMAASVRFFESFGVRNREFAESDYVRVPAGFKGGGRFMSKGAAVEAITENLSSAQKKAVDDVRAAHADPKVDVGAAEARARKAGVPGRVVDAAKKIEDDSAERSAGSPKERLARAKRVREERVAKSREASRELADALQGEKKVLGPSDAERVANAEKMFGTGSKQHVAAQKKFGAKGNETTPVGYSDSERGSESAPGKETPMPKVDPKYTARISDAQAKADAAKAEWDTASLPMAQMQILRNKSLRADAELRAAKVAEVFAHDTPKYPELFAAAKELTEARIARQRMSERHDKEYRASRDSGVSRAEREELEDRQLAEREAADRRATQALEVWTNETTASDVDPVEQQATYESAVKGSVGADWAVEELRADPDKAGRVKPGDTLADSALSNAGAETVVAVEPLKSRDRAAERAAAAADPSFDDELDGVYEFSGDLDVSTSRGSRSLETTPEVAAKIDADNKARYGGTLAEFTALTKQAQLSKGTDRQEADEAAWRAKQESLRYTEKVPNDLVQRAQDEGLAQAEGKSVRLLNAEKGAKFEADNLVDARESLNKAQIAFAEQDVTGNRNKKAFKDAKARLELAERRFGSAKTDSAEADAHLVAVRARESGGSAQERAGLSVTDVAEPSTIDALEVDTPATSGDAGLHPRVAKMAAGEQLTVAERTELRDALAEKLDGETGFKGTAAQRATYLMLKFRRDVEAGKSSGWAQGEIERLLGKSERDQDIKAAEVRQAAAVADREQRVFRLRTRQLIAGGDQPALVRAVEAGLVKVRQDGTTNGGDRVKMSEGSTGYLFNRSKADGKWRGTYVNEYGNVSSSPFNTIDNPELLAVLEAAFPKA